MLFPVTQPSPPPPLLHIPVHNKVNLAFPIKLITRLLLTKGGLLKLNRETNHLMSGYILAAIFIDLDVIPIHEGFNLSLFGCEVS